MTDKAKAKAKRIKYEIFSGNIAVPNEKGVMTRYYADPENEHPTTFTVDSGDEALITLLKDRKGVRLAK